MNKKRILALSLILALLVAGIPATGVAAQPAPSASFAVEGEENIVREDVSLRGEFEKHFLLDNGSYMAVSYNDPVHERDETGKWVEIDNTLIQVGGTLTNANNKSFQVAFSDKASDNKLVSLKSGKNELSWSVRTVSSDQKINALNRSAAAQVANTKSASKVAADKIASSVTYPNAAAGHVDLRYTVLPNRVKEDVILNAPSGFSAYIMTLEAPGLTAALNADNSVDFRDASGKARFRIQSPYMYDAVGESSADIAVTVAESNGTYEITYTPGAEWLNDASRVYPVVIDPQVETSKVRTNFVDTYVYDGGGAVNNEDTLYVGIKSGKVHRAYWKCISLPTIPSGYAITNAFFNLQCYTSTTTSRPFSLYKVRDSWDGAGIRWGTQPSADIVQGQSGVARNPSTNKITFSGDAVASMVASWYVFNLNYGLMIRYTDESTANPDYNAIYSSDYLVNTAYMPTLTIFYSDAGARAPDSSSSGFVDCLAFAFDLGSDTFNDGTYWTSADKVYCASATLSDALNRMKTKMIPWLNATFGTGKWREVPNNSPGLSSGEWLVCMRVGQGSYGGTYAFDYHFWYRASNGIWYNKHGGGTSVIVSDASDNVPVNPSTADSYDGWRIDNPTYSGYYYKSSTVYYVVKKI